MKRILSSAMIILAALSASCSMPSYRTDSDVSFDTTNGVSNQSEILILETDYPDNNYKSLGWMSGEVKKRTAFNKDPTKEQVNIVLSEKAKDLGADAVIKVTYKSGVGVTTWGYMRGSGEAIKIGKSREMPSSQKMPPLRQIEQPSSQKMPPLRQIEQPSSQKVPPLRQIEQPSSQKMPPLRQIEQPSSQTVQGNQTTGKPNYIIAPRLSRSNEVDERDKGDCELVTSITKNVGGTGGVSNFVKRAKNAALTEAANNGADSYFIVNTQFTIYGASVTLEALKCK